MPLCQGEEKSWEGSGPTPNSLPVVRRRGGERVKAVERVTGTGVMDLVQSDWQKSPRLLLWVVRSRLTMQLDLLCFQNTIWIEEHFTWSSEVLQRLRTSDNLKPQNCLFLWHTSVFGEHLQKYFYNTTFFWPFYQLLWFLHTLTFIQRLDVTAPASDFWGFTGFCVNRQTEVFNRKLYEGRPFHWHREHTDKEKKWGDYKGHGERGKPHRAIFTGCDDSFHSTLQSFFRILTGLKRELCNRPEFFGKVKVSPKALLALLNAGVI